MFLTHTPTRALHAQANILPHPTHPQRRFEIIDASLIRDESLIWKSVAFAVFAKLGTCPLRPWGSTVFCGICTQRAAAVADAAGRGRRHISLCTARSGGRPAKSVVPAAALESPWEVRPVCCFRGPGSCIKLGRGPPHPTRSQFDSADSEVAQRREGRTHGSAS